MNNTYLIQQCSMMLSSIKLFRHGARAACVRDDGQIDKQEQKMLAKIERDLVSLERTLRDIVR